MVLAVRAVQYNFLEIKHLREYSSSIAFDLRLCGSPYCHMAPGNIDGTAPFVAGPVGLFW